MTTAKTIYAFLAGTFGLASIAFVAMLTVPGAQSPEGMPGLPIWLLAIWSPSITAMIIAYQRGKLKSLLRRIIALKAAAPALTIIVVPTLILIAFMISSGKQPDWSALPPILFIGLILFQLVLGPLGEELGWRGLLLPALEIRFGWLGAALVVGLIWTIWHAPLWLFESPQSQIPFAIFAGHAMFYSILMGAAHRLAPHSLVPAIALHLSFNVVVASALIWGITDIASFYTITLPLYGLAAILVAGLLRGKAGCPIPQAN